MGRCGGSTQPTWSGARTRLRPPLALPRRLTSGFGGVGAAPLGVVLSLRPRTCHRCARPHHCRLIVAVVILTNKEREEEGAISPPLLGHRWRATASCPRPRAWRPASAAPFTCTACAASSTTAPTGTASPSSARPRSCRRGWGLESAPPQPPPPQLLFTTNATHRHPPLRSRPRPTVAETVRLRATATTIMLIFQQHTHHPPPILSNGSSPQRPLHQHRQQQQ